MHQTYIVQTLRACWDMQGEKTCSKHPFPPYIWHHLAQVLSSRDLAVDTPWPNPDKEPVPLWQYRWITAE